MEEIKDLKVVTSKYVMETLQLLIEKGIETGENKRALKDAVNFLKLGVSVEIVAQGTGLSIDIIRELKKEIMN